MPKELCDGLRAACALLCLVAGAAHAGAQTYDYTWLGTHGCTSWTSKQPTDPGYYGNGWGNTWHYTEESDPYYPSASDSVLVPDGETLSVQGTGHCGTLTLGAGALLYDGKVEIHNGALANEGTVAMERSVFVHSAAFDLTGTGTFHLTGPVSSGGGSSSLYFFGHYCDATIAAEQHVHGTGDIGVPNSVTDRRQPNLTNHAEIRADAHDSAILRIYGWTGCANDGLLVASDGATLQIAGQWDNTGGTIRAEDGGTVRFTADYDTNADGEKDTVITGGDLEALGDGTFTVTAGKGVVLQDLTLSGKVSVPAYEAIGINGTVSTTAGTSLLISRQTKGNGTAPLYLHGHATLDGQGQTVLGDGGLIQSHETVTVDPILTVGPEHTLVLRQTTHFASTTTCGLDNQGTVLFDPTIDDLNVASVNYAYAGTTNYGDIVTEGDYDKRIEWYGDFTQQAGSLIVNGYFFFNQAGNNYAFDILGGVLGGSGELRGGGDGLTIGSGATVSPGGSTGTITLNTDVTVQDGADCVFEISDADQDLVVVAGELTFEGAVNVVLKPYQLTGERELELTLFEFDAISGVPTVNVSGPAGWSWGDVSQVGDTLILADVNVPEPASLVLMALGGLAVLRRRQ